MADLGANPLVKKLLSLGLPPDDFVVFGSGPLMARGLRESHDLDVLARGAAWEKARAAGEPRLSKQGDPAAVFFGGEIEVFGSWGPGVWDVDGLIDGADVIDGIRFATLENVLKWKRLLGRPKDLADIALIEAYLGDGRTPS